MPKSIAFAADPSRLASLLLSYIPAVCAFVAPRHPGASAAIIDRLSHSRALSESRQRSMKNGPKAEPTGRRAGREAGFDETPGNLRVITCFGACARALSR